LGVTDVPLFSKIDRRSAMMPRKKLDIPRTVSGRLVTNRGVHLQPFGHHSDWLGNAAYWVDLLVSMGMSWVVLITDGDAVRQTHCGLNPLKVLLDAGVIPIIREQRLFPAPFADQEPFLWTVDLYGQYGLKPLWILRNEPFDVREWVNGQVPPNAWEIVMEVWAQGAQFMASHGGYVGFPDGPSYGFNPFESIKAYGCQWIFDQGLGYYAGHCYGENRPRDYPYDAVTRYGAPLTEEAYRGLLDDFADDPSWQEDPIELINQRRRQLESPHLTALQDDTCWRSWEKIARWSLDSFGYVVPMAMTEGGWVPRDRSGSGSNGDIRVPHTTPKMVAKKTLQMYDAPSPFFALCPWLLAAEDMGGMGWPFDAWHGSAYSEKYGRKKPVILMLQHVPPKEIRSRSTPMVIDVNGNTRDWAWAHRAYGASYQRGTSTLQLIEVHEYEGPATLDVWVVDSDGLPVEGVEFYYSYPGARAIGGDEWCPNGVLGATGPDGRLSFEAKERPCLPGACQGAVWPKGKGDLLEKIGLLAGSNNRRLNGMWRLVIEDMPLLPDLPEELDQHGDPYELDESEEPETSAWTMSVEYRPGARIIAGSFPRAGIEVTVSDPWGNASTVTSGSKAEYGPGGFEVLAPQLATYTLSFLGESFQVQMQDGASIVTFTEVAPPEPEPEPEPPVSNWALVFEKLDRIEELIACLPPLQSPHEAKPESPTHLAGG
jgi:hypothetical protein